MNIDIEGFLETVVDGILSTQSMAIYVDRNTLEYVVQDCLGNIDRIPVLDQMGNIRKDVSVTIDDPFKLSNISKYFMKRDISNKLSFDMTRIMYIIKNTIHVNVISLDSSIRSTKLNHSLVDYINKEYVFHDKNYGEFEGQHLDGIISIFDVTYGWRDAFFKYIIGIDFASDYETNFMVVDFMLKYDFPLTFMNVKNLKISYNSDYITISSDHTLNSIYFKKDDKTLKLAIDVDKVIPEHLSEIITNFYMRQLT